jgi:hypothetical protein
LEERAIPQLADDGLRLSVARRAVLREVEREVDDLLRLHQSLSVDREP